MVEARLNAKRNWKLRGVILLAGVLAFGSLLLARSEQIHEYWLYGDCCGWAASNARNAATSLKTIWSAQNDYRVYDRDGNGVKDYWRADIAGLYTQHPGNNCGKDAIRLIEQSVAAADERPATDFSPYGARAPKSGYWIRSLLHEDEQTPSPDRFAACAFPSILTAGKWTYILCEENVLYRKALKGQRPPERFPKDPLKSGWTRID